jgi:hypothetical protein
MRRHFIQDEVPEHGLYLEDKLLMLRQIFQDEALKHKLFLEHKLRMPRHFV